MNLNYSEETTSKKKLIIGIIIAVVLLGLVSFFAFRKRNVEPINPDEAKSSKELPIANEGPVSPISGLQCDNWNRRPIAIMQASDVPARPSSGFSQADMVIEMPVITASITRLMGVYICNDPGEVGSMRSARHDFVNLAKSLDAIFVHWGRSEMEWFIEKLNEGVVDNMNCNGDAGKNANQYCFRKEGFARGVDTGYVKFADILQGAQDFGYRMENQFSGYPHQAEAPLDQRPDGGKLRVAFAGPYAAEYEYNKENNNYVRYWGGEKDQDRFNGEEIAPKNIAVLFAVSEQIEGQYNNVELGDPWMDKNESGEAYYYFNGKEYRGSWKKDKSRLDSKLFMYDENGNEIKFVPGQIWLEILEPGQNLRWEENASQENQQQDQTQQQTDQATQGEVGI